MVEIYYFHDGKKTLIERIPFYRACSRYPIFRYKAFLENGKSIKIRDYIYSGV